MKSNKPYLLGKIGLLGATLILVSACGGSSSSSSEEASPIVSKGIITGFGSVYVNRHRFRTSSASFSLDDAVGTEDELRIGMLVTVHGRFDGFEYRADRIEYDNELKGPIAAIVTDLADASSKTLSILGQDVLVNSLTTFDDDGGLTFDSLTVGDVVEVSGYVGDSLLMATHIELQVDADEIELKGVIENLTADTFDLNGFRVNYDLATEIDTNIDPLVEGLYVEAEGQLDAGGTILNATRIEAEDDGIPSDADEVEVEGSIADYNPVDRSFTIAGVSVDAGNAFRSPASLVLGNGVVVEAEGSWTGGILVARKIEQKGKEVEIDGYLSAVDSDSSTVRFNFNGTDVVARINRQTELEDEINDLSIQLADLSAGDYVQLEGFADDDGTLNVVELERDEPGEIAIEAAVDSYDASAMSVQMLGASFDLSAARFEDENDVEISAEAFFDALTDGRFIEIEDDDANGVFEKAELDD